MSQDLGKKGERSFYERACCKNKVLPHIDLAPIALSMSNLVRDCIQKRRGESGLFSFEYNLLPLYGPGIKVSFGF